MTFKRKLSKFISPTNIMLIFHEYYFYNRSNYAWNLAILQVGPWRGIIFWLGTTHPPNTARSELDNYSLRWFINFLKWWEMCLNVCKWSLEGVWTVYGMYMECIWKVPGIFWKVSRRCNEGVFRHLEGVRVFGRCLEGVWNLKGV